MTTRRELRIHCAQATYLQACDTCEWTSHSHDSMQAAEHARRHRGHTTVHHTRLSTEFDFVDVTVEGQPEGYGGM